MTRQESTTMLSKGMQMMGLPQKEDSFNRLLDFAEFLLAQNEMINLTAITEMEEVITKHLLDSISPLLFVDHRQKKLIDIGCGAGFPGLVLKLYDPTMDITLVDSTKKKLDFIEKACEKTGVKVPLIHARAEEKAMDVTYREQYDIVFSRAVASLPVLAELCLPYVKTGGWFLPLKGPLAKQELTEAKHAIEVLGGKVESIFEYDIPFLDCNHKIVRIQKIRRSPGKYPRRFSKIKTSPIR